GKGIDEEITAQAAEAAYDAAHPIAKIGSTPGYRRKMVRVLTRRAIWAVVSSRRGKSDGKADHSTDGQR
nr:hypothetical protein [Anaerolineae bacterium]